MPPPERPRSARGLQDRLQTVRDRHDAKTGRQRLALDVDAADLGDPEDLREHRPHDDTPHRHPPPARPIPAHLRQFLVAPDTSSRWRDDYDHNPEALSDDGKSPRYPGGRCVRIDCWPCTIARLDSGEPRDWAGVARMARSRQAAGVDLDDLDREALNRDTPAPTQEA